MGIFVVSIRERKSCKKMSKLVNGAAPHQSLSQGTDRRWTHRGVSDMYTQFLCFAKIPLLSSAVGTGAAHLPVFCLSSSLLLLE